MNYLWKRLIVSEVRSGCQIENTMYPLITDVKQLELNQFSV